MRLVIVLIATFAVACQPKAAPSDLHDQAADESRIAILGVYHMASAPLGATINTVGHTKSVRVIGAVVGLLASYQTINMISALGGLHGPSELAYYLSLNSKGSYVSIRNRDVIRHLRRYQNVYLMQSPDDFVDEEGRVTDQFLDGMLVAWNYDQGSREEKINIIRQIHRVLTIDRDEGVVSTTYLELDNITDPRVLELNLGMNTIRDDYNAEARQRAIQYSTLAAIAQTASIGSILPLQERNQTSYATAMGLWALAAIGTTAWSYNYMDPLTVALNGDEFSVRQQDLALSFSTYRTHFINRTVDDLITNDGHVEDSLAEAFLSVWNQTEKRWSPDQKRRVLKQLLIVVRADPNDKAEDLALRGVTDTQFIEMFEAWKAIRYNSSTAE